MANHYDIPKWAGKPPVGYHLDVSKDGKLIQKLMVDEKKCYLFGRNPQLNDFCIDHASCSRVHSSLVYHKHLKRAFLVDLGSTHGTYIGNLRIESNKPTQLPVDSQFHFGASTRIYTLREHPQPMSRQPDDKSADDESGVVGLPETEIELDNLTEFNTAHNRRISMLGIVDEEVRSLNRKRKKKSVNFNEDEEIINPEDIDPTVGRFRNLVQMTVVPTKKRKLESGMTLSDGHSIMNRRLHQPLTYTDDLYSDLPGPTGEISSSSSTISSFMFSSTLTNKLGLNLPNPAPDVEQEEIVVEPPPTVGPHPVEAMALEPKKKKYAKEAWPGKKPNPSLLM